MICVMHHYRRQPDPRTTSANPNGAIRPQNVSGSTSTPVNRHFRAGNQPRFFARQVNHRGCDLIRFADSPQVEIHCQDALHNKNRLSDVLQRELTDSHSPPAALVDKPPVAPAKTPADEPPVGSGGAISLVANLPYAIAAPLLINLLLEAPQMRRFCFTVQREVADRMVSEPNRKTYGPLSITLQATCHIRRIASIPRAVFWPRPQVDSQMLRLDRMPDGPLSHAELGQFVSLVRASFLHRRKTMAYNIESAVGAESAKLVADLIDRRARPENVTVSQWITIHRRLHEDDVVAPIDAHPADV